MEKLIVTKEKSCYRDEGNTIPCLKREVDSDVNRLEEIGKPITSRKDKGLCMQETRKIKLCSYECLYTFPYPY